MKAFITLKPLLLVLVCASVTALLLAEPAWWVQRGVRDPGKAPSDFAVLNQGQLKNLARAARDEMNEKMPGGAGTAVNALMNAWGTPAESARDYGAVNQGQLKSVAKVFYDRLIEAGVATSYPWTAATSDDADYSAVNLGQAKSLFSFNVFTDTDGDGIDDAWEMIQFGTLNRSSTLDADGDGIMDVAEFAAGTSAFSWDSDNDGISDAVEAAQNSALLAQANLRLFQKIK